MKRLITVIIIAAVIIAAGAALYKLSPSKTEAGASGSTAAMESMETMGNDESTEAMGNDESTEAMGNDESTEAMSNDESTEATETTADKAGSFQIISAEEAKKMMDEEEVTIVDVRRQDEYDAGHVKGAILVPNETIGDVQPELLPDKDATLLVYCRTGIRAADASQKLVDLGYTNVYDFGGIVDWPYEQES